MMLLCGQSNRCWSYWAGSNPGSVGLLLSPNYWKKVPIDPWMPFVLDNGAFAAWRDKKEWDVKIWRDMIFKIHQVRKRPLWAAVPDVVADRVATLESWRRYSGEIMELGWSTAFCCQDGMTPDDVPEDADVVFIGGTDQWKFKSVPMFSDFPRVHVARVNPIDKIEMCEKLWCESVDGTGWFRDPTRRDKLPAISKFINGHRNPPRPKQMELITT